MDIEKKLEKLEERIDAMSRLFEMTIKRCMAIDDKLDRVEGKQVKKVIENKHPRGFCGDVDCYCNKKRKLKCSSCGELKLKHCFMYPNDIDRECDNCFDKKK